MDDAQVELAALRELGLAGASDAAAPPGGGGPLESLRARGLLQRHQVLAARAWIAQHMSRCPCGAWARRGAACTGCGRPPVEEPAAAPLRPERGPGSRLGPYLLLELLGRGANGAVYRARHRELGRDVALKLIRGGLDPRRRQRFQREVEALARLDHPGIVRVHSARAEEDALVCEMELVEGETLEERVLRDGPLPWRAATELLLELARAVHYAHERGVLHRDLKPSNVLLRRDGRPVLADLGLARLEDQASSLTADGALVGTPHFMAPETFAGPATACSDVYGLGAVFYFALSGRPPFEGESLQALLAAAASGTCPPTPAPHAVEAVRARAMAPEPTRRTPSARALAEDLEALLEGRTPTWSGRGSWAERWPVPPGGRRALLGIPLLGLALLLGLAARRPGTPEPEPGAAGRAPASAGEAIELLAGAEAPPAAREAALAALTRALHDAEPAEEAAALASALEAACGQGPPPWELAVTRARLARVLERPLVAPDLAAVASHCPPGEQAPLLEAAVARGLTGPDALKVARGCYEARPDSQAASALLGIEACLSGDLDLRGLARERLGQARPGAGRAATLLSALLAVDALVEALRGPAEVFEISAAAQPPAEALLPRVVALVEEGLAPAVTVVLGPLEARLRSAAVNLGAVEEGPVREALLRVLDAARPGRAPPLICLAEVLREGLASATPPAEPELLSAAAEEVARYDPLVAAASQQGWARRLLEQKPSAGTTPQELALVREFNQRTLDALATYESATDSHYVALLIRRRALIDLSRLEEHLAAEETAPALRRARLEAGLRLAQAALELARELNSKQHLRYDATQAAQLLYALDRVEETRELLPLLGSRERPLRAELLRRGGDPAAALELLAAGAPADQRETRAVRALVLSDLGRTEEARGELALLRQIEARTAPSDFWPLRSEAVARALGEAR